MRVRKSAEVMGSRMQVTQGISAKGVCSHLIDVAAAVASLHNPLGLLGRHFKGFKWNSSSDAFSLNLLKLPSLRSVQTDLLGVQTLVYLTYECTRGVCGPVAAQDPSIAKLSHAL